MDDFLTRGVEAILPTKDSLEKRLAEGPISLYLGIDPTAPTLHLGHLATLLKLRDFQLAGHKTIVLFGDITAMIGDPTDKSSARQVLNAKEVEKNLTDYQNQILKILDPKLTTFHFNSEWYGPMALTEFIYLTTKITAQHLFKREMFKQRAEEGKDIYLNELIYPVLQGYDSVALDVDLEIGGNDQLFNMLVGRDLTKKITGREKFVLTTKLLTDSSGKKMGKTDGNAINLNDKPDDVFGKVMSWSDALMPLGFELLTRIPVAEYHEVLAGHPKEAKIALARAVTAIIHNEELAQKAEEKFNKTFSSSSTPEVEAEEIATIAGANLGEFLIEHKVVPSKSEYRRLVEQKAVEFNGETISDQAYKLETDGLVRVGKHRFVKIKVN